MGVSSPDPRYCPFAPHVAVIRSLLDHAERLISSDTGMVVCWHEYTDEETLDAECVQCAVQHAQDALGDLVLAAKAQKASRIKRWRLRYRCWRCDRHGCCKRRTCPRRGE